MSEKNNKLAKWFRYGEDRNKVGNTAKKRYERMLNRRKRPFQPKRLLKKGIKTNLLSNVLAEKISLEGETPEQYVVSFKKRPLIHKCFIAEVVQLMMQPVERVVAQEFQDKVDRYHADYQHALREIGRIDEKFKEEGADEEALNKQKKGYEDLRDKVMKKIERLTPKAQSYYKQNVNYPRVKTKKIRLRVVQIIGHTEQTGYECICHKSQEAFWTKNERKLLAAKTAS